MCKLGDIILVNNYKHGDKILSRHSFVVISDENGTIRGLPYDIVCNVLSSFKDEKQRERKLQYPGNFPISHDDTITNPDNGKDGYLKTDQLYFFNTAKLDYRVIGKIDDDTMKLIMEFIEDGDFEIIYVTDNL